MEDFHLKTDTVYRVCTTVLRFLDGAVLHTADESKETQTGVAALFIRKRIYPNRSAFNIPLFTEWTIVQFVSNHSQPLPATAP